MGGGLIEADLLALHVCLGHECDIDELEEEGAVLVLDDPEGLAMAYFWVNLELLDLASSMKLLMANSWTALLADAKTASKSSSSSSWV